MTGKITKIDTQKRAGRYNVYLNDKYAFAVSEEVLIRYRLAKGLEIDDGLEKEIVASDDVSKLYSRSLDYLSHQLRAESEVREKLSGISENQNAIDEVIQRLIDEKLIDDQNYADSYVRTMILTSDKGPSVIRRNLKSKKISDQIIEDSVAQFSDDQMKENASKLAEKQFKHYHNQPFKMRMQKVRQSLMVKGFSTDLINSVFEDLDFVEETDEEMDGLNREAEKIWRRNSRYEEKERILKTKRTLFSKGYDINNIKEWLQLANENEKNSK